MNLNKVTLAGRITRDPEIRMTPQGTAICAFGIAINRQWKDSSGAQKEEVTFLDCEAWAKTAEIIGKHFTKGKPIYVEGRLKVEQWDDKTTGAKRSKIKVVVESFQFVGGPRDEAGAASSPNPERGTFSGVSSAAAAPADDGSDVPF